MKPTDALTSYLKRGHTGRHAQLLSFVSSYKVAENLFSSFDENSFRCPDETTDDGHVLTLEVASKQLPTHHPVFSFLQANPHPAILATCLFGSLADGTQCNYSDFDGLLVIDGTRIRSAASLLRLRKIVRRTEALMLETDPLQHHGWHIALTDDEKRILTIDIPLKVLTECMAVHSSEPIRLQPCSSIQNLDALDSYRQTIASIRKKLADSRSSSCLYTFKNLCSEFMLVPALFIQAMGKPVSKKDSFRLIEQYITTDKLSALRTVSEWRRHWIKPELNNQVRLFHAARKAGFRFSFLLSPVPAHFQKAYPEWKVKAESFLGACDQKLGSAVNQS